VLAEYFPILKAVHVTSVILSGASFFVRGLWMIYRPGMLARPWVKKAPPVVDTILLLSALLMTVVIKQYPWTHAWLAAKATAVLIYIGLGMVAITYGRTCRTRIAAWVAALLVFGYIVSVALTHSVLPT